VNVFYAFIMYMPTANSARNV